LLAGFELGGVECRWLIAGLLDVIQRDRLGPDYLDRRKGLIDAVSQDDVRRVAKRLLKPGALAVVVVGDPKGM